MNEWKVIIDSDLSIAHRRLYICREAGPNEHEVLYYNPETEVFDRKIISGLVRTPPTFTFPRFLRIEEKMLEALINAGIRPESESINEGKLEAMGKHLEDMRRLVFRGKK